MIEDNNYHLSSLLLARLGTKVLQITSIVQQSEGIDHMGVVIICGYCNNQL